VGNTLSDTLGTMLLLAGLQLDERRAAVQCASGVVARFLSLEVSSQAFLLAARRQTSPSATTAPTAG
jgi:hypothetical protein